VTVTPIIAALRPHQWAKNGLLFVPLLMSHRLADWPRIAAAALAFVCFSLCASGVYVMNDLHDRETDRAHPRKRHRPFASGALGTGTGVVLIVASFAAGFGLALWKLPPLATAMLGLYVAVTTAYSFYLKRKAMLDVLALAGLYTQRILTGGVASGVAVSEWLLAFSMFFFVSLAFAKRYTELSTVPVGAQGRIQGRGYFAQDLDLVRTLGPAIGCLSALVLVLYINLSPEVERLYPARVLLYPICPVIMYWITRVWFLAQRGQLHDDPVVFAMKDRISLAAGVVTVALVVAASLAPPGLLLVPAEVSPGTPLASSASRAPPPAEAPPAWR
jgi:4-hydroxybenzoate polyprenyltransferase